MQRSLIEQAVKAPAFEFRGGDLRQRCLGGRLGSWEEVVRKSFLYVKSASYTRNYQGDHIPQLRQDAATMVSVFPAHPSTQPLLLRC